MKILSLTYRPPTAAASATQAPKERPSLLGELAACERRYWYRVRQNRALWSEQFGTQESHLQGLEPEDEWLYEVRLPSGSRMDGWNRSEQIAVEFKNEVPKEHHLVQAAAYQQELNRYFITKAQVQLWYPHYFERETHLLAAGLGLYSYLNHEQYAAIILPERLDEWEEELQGYAIRALEIRQMEQPPQRLNRYEPACRYCPLYNYCQLNAEREEQQ